MWSWLTNSDRSSKFCIMEGKGSGKLREMDDNQAEKKGPQDPALTCRGAYQLLRVSLLL